MFLGGRFRFLSCLAVIAGLLFVVPPSEAVSPAALTPEEIVSLGKLGFSEDDLRAELEPFNGAYRIGSAGLEALESAGFSDEFVSFVKSLRPRMRIDNAALAAMLADGATAVEMLRSIDGAQTSFDTSARAILQLNQDAELPLSVITAMRGAALSAPDLETLAEAAVSGEELDLLIGIVDVVREPLPPTTALALAASGIPSEQIARIRARTAEQAPPEPAMQVDASAIEFTSFNHVMDLFSLRYPSEWRLVRQIESDEILYVATPESGVTDIATMQSGAALVASALGDAGGLELEDIMSKVIRGLQVHEPVPVFDEELHEATIAGQPGIHRSYTVAIDGDDEPIRGRLYFTVSGSYAYALIVQAPQGAFDAQLPVFERMAAELVVGAESWAAGESETPHTTAGLTQRFGEAVVQVKGVSGQNHGAGTGFIIREDGYLLTNAHVVLKPGTEEYWDEITVHWPERFGREPAKAEVLDAYFVQSELGRRTVGGALAVQADIALLKISASDPLPTIPVTRQEDVRLGDSVFVIGYPRPTDFDDQVSTTVTSGVITRYLHAEDGELQMIVTDAKIAAGNSGGPVISVRTGGVVGLATTAMSQEVIQQLEQANQAPDRASQLIGYNGVLPIAKGLRLFPHVMTVSADRDRRIDYLDAYDMALRSAQQGWIEGAVRSAEEAVELGRRQADAFSLLGRLKSGIAADTAMLEEGRKALDTALEIDPEHLPTLLFQIRHDLENREYLEAMRRANRAVSAAPVEWQTRFERARVNRILERYDEALEDLAEAQRLSADLFPEPYNLAGAVHYDKEEYEQGKASYEKAVAIAPMDIDARLGVGRYYLKAGNAFSALVEFDNLNADIANHPKVLHAIGDAYGQLEDHRKALDNYVEAVNLFYEHKLTPPEDLLIDAARTAVRHVRAASTGVQLYARHITNYYESEKTLGSHQLLAEEMKDNPGIVRAHLMRALELIRGKEEETEKERAERLNKQMEEVRTASLTEDEIDRARKARYPDGLVARFIRMDNLPLALQLRGSTDARGQLDAERTQHIQELAQKLGATLTNEIYRRVRAQEGAQAQRQQNPDNNNAGPQQNAGATEPAMVELPGTWLYEGRTGHIELNLAGDQTYAIAVIRDGQRQPFDQGRWRLSEDRAGLVLVGAQQGENHFRTQVIDHNTIVLTANDGNQWRYQRR